ncbi:MAG: hypothetical protein EXR07_18230 [Acetobacteraceae bacterium]|nr:hypothetical protein [Acetobacteraceae bacterium]
MAAPQRGRQFVRESWKPGFLDTCAYLGYIQGERRWRDKNGMLFTWDAMHGEIECFTAQGKHTGAADSLTGVKIKPARKGRRIRV